MNLLKIIKIMKNKETIEEVAENFWLNDNSMTDNDRISYVNGFIECAKWQAERSYSEEEVLDMLNNLRLDSYNHGMGRIELLEWFEKFKKPTQWYNEEQTNKRMNVIGQNGNDGTHYEKN